MIGYCDDLSAAFRRNHKDKVAKWLKELEEENNRELSIAKEFSVGYLLSLHGLISKEIDEIKGNLDDPKKCIGFVDNILKSLSKVTDQREVRDKIIKKIIHPLLKSWGYKKKKRTFVKKEGDYVKKLSVFTSQVCDYYDVKFIFEINIEGQETKHLAHRVKQKWFKLTQDKDLDKTIKEIKTHLLNDIKPFLDKFK